jgi:hypothetical protein
MPAVKQRKPKTAFSPREFDELLSRFSVESGSEVDDAFFAALQMCDRAGLTFRDAARNVYGQDDQIAALKTQLEEGRCLGDGETDLALDRAAEVITQLKSERQELTGQLTAERARTARLRDQNQRLQKDSALCGACHRKREILAVVTGIAILAGCLRWLPAHGLKPWSLALGTVLSALLPLAVTLGRWRWLLFSRKVKWVSARDNELVRWWKELA